MNRWGLFAQTDEIYTNTGNICELQNIIERAVILSQGLLLDITPFQPNRSDPKAVTNKLRILEAVEREHIPRTLETTG